MNCENYKDYKDCIKISVHIIWIVLKPLYIKTFVYYKDYIKTHMY